MEMSTVLMETIMMLMVIKMIYKEMAMIFEARAILFKDLETLLLVKAIMLEK